MPSQIPLSIPSYATLFPRQVMQQNLEISRLFQVEPPAVAQTNVFATSALLPLSLIFFFTYTYFRHRSASFTRLAKAITELQFTTITRNRLPRRCHVIKPNLYFPPQKHIILKPTQDQDPHRFMIRPIPLIHILRIYRHIQTPSRLTPRPQNGTSIRLLGTITIGSKPSQNTARGAAATSLFTIASAMLEEQPRQPHPAAKPQPHGQPQTSPPSLHLLTPQPCGKVLHHHYQLLSSKAPEQIASHNISPNSAQPFPSALLRSSGERHRPFPLHVRLPPVALAGARSRPPRSPDLFGLGPAAPGYLIP